MKKITGQKALQYLISTPHFLSWKEISCQRQICSVTGSIFLALEEISCHREKLIVTWRNIMPQLEILCPQSKKKQAYIYGYMIKKIYILTHIFNTQITCIFNTFCRVWHPPFHAKFLAESIDSHEVKYSIPRWLFHKMGVDIRYKI